MLFFGDVVSLFLWVFLFKWKAPGASQQDVLPFVDPLIGSSKLGHSFAGATVPYGMVKAVSDTTYNNRGGFSGDGRKVSGFSHMHDSGTGGGSSMGNFPLFPFAGCKGDEPSGCLPFGKRDRAIKFNNTSVYASAGYFSIELATKIVGEMTATAHTALYRFNFPEKATHNKAEMKPLILVDLTDLYDSRSDGIVNLNPITGRVSGAGTFEPGFGTGTYETFFCADFAGADLLNSGIWSGDKVMDSKTVFNASGGAPHGGAFLYFNKPHHANQVIVRVGQSFIGEDRACENAEREIPNFESSFNNVRSAAEKLWAKKLEPLSITTGGVDENLQVIFWSGVYRTMISPQDYTGENPLWDSPEPYFDSFYCLWDAFRTTHPFLTIFDPKENARMLRSLIDIYKHAGYLPDCRMQLSKGITQGGSNAEAVLADAYVKGLKEGIDYELGYKGMIKDAEVMPSQWLVEGRGHLENYKSLGYVPKDDNGGGYGLYGASISRTVEYAYDDFCIAEMAKAMGKDDDYKKYIKRASNWKNHFNPNQTSEIDGKDTGFTGFLQPRMMNGDFAVQEPSRGAPVNHENCCGMFSRDIETYEGSCWLYTFFAPGDMAALIKELGGPKEFVKRLDYFHENGLVDIGNENALLTAFQYHFAGRPGRSAYRIRQYIPQEFNTTKVGMPGNEDGGAVGAFIAFSMMGLYPNAGQNVYLILPPFFESVSVKNALTGKTATVKATNFDPSGKRIYIQSAKLNGKAYTKNWLDHSFFLDGGTLELVVGAKESTWGQADEDLPPSHSTSGIHY